MERQKTLAQFFRVAQKAFELERKFGKKLTPASRSRFKPWQSDASFHSAFLRKVERAMQRQIEVPRRELEKSIFRRGMELLQRNMPFDRLPDCVGKNYLHWQSGEKTLREALRIDQLKSELKKVRESGDVVRISAKEREIAGIIQLAVSSFPYKPAANNPSEMIANQHINCVGASILGGALMQGAGLNYLVGDVPSHSILFLVTSDGHVEWRDMLSPQFNEDLADKIIIGDKKDGLPLKVADIVAFSKKPKPEGLMFDITSEKYKDKLPYIKEGQRQYVTVFDPEYGQQIQILNNMGNVLSDLGRKEEAIEAYRQAIAINPKNAYPYNNMGTALSSLGRKEEAIEAYRQAIAIDPKNAYPYNNMGNVLSDLGRKEEAIEAYRKLIELADKRKDEYRIKQVERMIAKLQKL